MSEEVKGKFPQNIAYLIMEIGEKMVLFKLGFCYLLLVRKKCIFIVPKSELKQTGRQHEFLSDMEKNYFYILEYSDSVTYNNFKYNKKLVSDNITVI